MKFGAFGLLLVTLFGTTQSQAQDTTAKPPTTQAKGNVHMVEIKHVPARLMAFWLDPNHNTGPEPGESAEEYFRRDLSKTIPKPRVAEATQTGTLSLPEGILSIKAIDALKSLLVIGNDAGMRELQKTIAFLDQPMRHVEVEAQAVQIDPADAEALGLDLSTPTNPNTIRFLSSAIFSPSQKLTALNKAKNLLTSRVVATNNLTTHLFPVPPTKLRAVVEPKESAFPFQWDVVPTINNDDTITLWLSGHKTPKTEKAKPTDSLQTILNIKNGDSLLIYGFEPGLLPVEKDAKPMTLILLVTSRIVDEKK